jgi:hypothetical protein
MRNGGVLLLKKEMSFSAFMEDLRKRFRNIIHLKVYNLKCEAIHSE